MSRTKPSIHIGQLETALGPVVGTSTESAEEGVEPNVAGSIVSS
jgi:hypothetical protein